MRLAIVCDWLTVFGGAEHVIAECHALWPEAPIFTSVARKSAVGPLANADIRTSRLQRLYTLLRNHQVLLPLMPRTLEGLDLRAFDVILSSSHAVAKGVVPPAHAVHICYCHTPMRYAWEMEEEYLRDFRIPRKLWKSVKVRLRNLRRWDLTTAKRVDSFIANSRETQERIRRVYGRESVVLPPPVHDRFFAVPLQRSSDSRVAAATEDRAYFLALGRFVPYKRFDLVIEAARMLNVPLKIVGTGQEEKTLRSLAGPTVEFLGHVPDDVLPSLYAGAKALLFPPHEDAGLVALEAQAAGTPVIALKSGGALDAIRDGETGIFFEKQTPESLADAMQRFGTMSFDAKAIREHAKQFSREKFREKLLTIVQEARSLVVH